MSVNNTEAPPDQNSTSSTSKKLNREFERLKTFPLNWEHGCSKRSLAEQGLYYEDDGVICAFCDHKNASNLSGDLQKVHSINCDFANGKQTQNIPLGNLHDTSFRVEQHRLITFLTVNWTAPVDPHDLAKWGFYYTGSADNCKCPFCRLEIRGWEPGDRGLSEHQRWNPQCRFITGHSVGNIPLGQENSETGTNVTSCANLGTQLGAVTLRDAKHPRYASTYARLASYDLWPMSISQRPEELVEAGLFYTGRGDRVICFHCGGGLKDWGLNDDPWEEHARWFSECSYVRQMKSKSLIESYSKKRKNEADENKNQLRKQTKPNRSTKYFDEIERLKTFPKRWDLFLTTSLLASSGFYYSGNFYNEECTCAFCDVVLNASAYDTGTMQAIHLSLSPDCDFANGRTTQNVALGTERNFSIEQHRLASFLSSDWPAHVDVYNLANWGLYYMGPGDNVKCFSCNVEFSGWNRGDNIATVHQRRSRNCQFLESRGIKTDNLQQEHSENILTAEQNTTTAPTIRPNTATQGPTLEELHGLHCRICLLRQIGAVLLPCGHMASCYECAPNVKKCPFCKKAVDCHIRAFI
ncbi:hypothetical protein B566_EDAN017294 [Ephemera danica]|nr:hypothetical protein B566_EDAN017294 [Ephemera danica]